MPTTAPALRSINSTPPQDVNRWSESVQWMNPNLPNPNGTVSRSPVERSQMSATNTAGASCRTARVFSNGRGVGRETGPAPGRAAAIALPSGDTARARYGAPGGAAQRARHLPDAGSRMSIPSPAGAATHAPPGGVATGNP